MKLHPDKAPLLDLAPHRRPDEYPRAWDDSWQVQLLLLIVCVLLAGCCIVMVMGLDLNPPADFQPTERHP